MPLNPPKLPISDSKLLNVALTHRSFLNENQESDEHNERLEYLGDAVLELAVSEYLYHKYPNKPEGKLTAFRASLVKTGTLAGTAAELNLGEMLKMSKGESVSGGRKNKSLLANTLEAVIGAIYLSEGYDEVVKFLHTHHFHKIDSIVENNLFKDYKSSLQELVQSKGHDSPVYKVISESGPDHDKVFTIEVIVGDNSLAHGTGKSKQQAQQHAAAQALERFKST